MFFKVLFNKINQGLKKRNLDPIFSIQKEETNKNAKSNSMREIEEEDDEIDK